jgi:hypothetical protein
MSFLTQHEFRIVVLNSQIHSAVQCTEGQTGTGEWKYYRKQRSCSCDLSPEGLGRTLPKLITSRRRVVEKGVA